MKSWSSLLKKDSNFDLIMGSCGSKPTGCGMGIRRKKNPTRKRLVVRKTSSLSHKLSQVDSSVSLDRSYCNPTYQGNDFFFLVMIWWNILWVIVSFYFGMQCFFWLVGFSWLFVVVCVGLDCCSYFDIHFARYKLVLHVKT